jgi:hypothetical protein
MAHGLPVNLLAINCMIPYPVDSIRNMPTPYPYPLLFIRVRVRVCILFILATMPLHAPQRPGAPLQVQRYIIVGASAPVQLLHAEGL